MSNDFPEVFIIYVSSKSITPHITAGRNAHGDAGRYSFVLYLSDGDVLGLALFQGYGRFVQGRCREGEYPFAILEGAAQMPGGLVLERLHRGGHRTEAFDVSQLRHDEMANLVGTSADEIVGRGLDDLANPLSEAGEFG